MPEIDISMQSILEEIRLNRSEITNRIDASETRLLMKIESINERVKELENENKQLKQEVELLKREQKKNNIVVFGLNTCQNTVTVENICQQLEELLEVHITPANINNLYKLGKSENSPIKIELLSHINKVQILKNCFKLKGKNVSITSEYTAQERKDNKILRHHLYLAKQDKNNTCYIKNNKLHVNEATYTPEDLLDIETDPTKPNSAPTTPIATVKEKRGDASEIPKVNIQAGNTPRKAEVNPRKPITRQNQQARFNQDPKIKPSYIK